MAQAFAGEYHAVMAEYCGSQRTMPPLGRCSTQLDAIGLQRLTVQRHQPAGATGYWPDEGLAQVRLGEPVCAYQHPAMPLGSCTSEGACIRDTGRYAWAWMFAGKVDNQIQKNSWMCLVWCAANGLHSPGCQLASAVRNLANGVVQTQVAAQDLAGAQDRVPLL